MKKTTNIRLLASPENMDAIQGILALLRKKGLHISSSDRPLKKTDCVLAVLSEQFYADDSLRTRLLDRLASGSGTVLLLQLDNAAIPQEIKNPLYSRNIISTAGKEDAQLAQRLYTSLPDVRNRLPLILAAGAAVLAILGGIFVWRSINSQAVAADTVEIPDTYGITQADLEAIRNVIIIGDHFSYYTAEDLNPPNPWPDLHTVATESWENNDRHWYSTEDGHEYTLTRYEDLTFLEYMPNLQNLDLVLVDVDADSLPNLQEAKKLHTVNIFSSTVDNLNWLSGSNVNNIYLYKTNVTDYSPLTGCPHLANLDIDFAYGREADFSGFASASLQNLYLRNLEAPADYSALSSCTSLKWVELRNLPVTDLSFLAEEPGLEHLELYDLYELTDISALSSLKSLKELHMERCGKLWDYTPIGSCMNLRQVFLQSNQPVPLDASFLKYLSSVQDIGIHGFTMKDMDFLKALQNKAISLSFSGDIHDYSGLAAITQYFFLHANLGGTNFSAIQPYLQDKSIEFLELFDCGNVDLSTLPEISSELHLMRCKLKDLTGMPAFFLGRLELREMQYLTSLDGIEAITTLPNQRMDLQITACPRLTDYSALEGMHLRSLSLVDTYTMPDFHQFEVNTLHLESIPDLQNLQCLEGMDGSNRHNFEFVGLDALQDISFLRNLPGTNLSVPPQVAEQAEDLVAEGVFKYYEIAYPDGSWNPLDSNFTLLSLDELQTLPKAVLRRISEVCVAGDQVFDPQYWYAQERWDKGKMTVVLHNWKTGEDKKITPGTIEDLSIFSELTGLRCLRLHCQPIRSLEGIQNFTQLYRLEANYCFDLEDASAVFALQDIQQILLQHSKVDSIQGVQNLYQLQELNVSGTKVTDLTALSGCDFSFADQNGGLNLGLNNIPCKDFSPLASVPRFRNLHVHELDAAKWEPYVADAEIYWLGCNINRDDSFSQLASRHPELTEIHMAGSPGVTDLTPLLDHENLQYVKVSKDMKSAINSLKGHEYSFRLDIEG